MSLIDAAHFLSSVATSTMDRWSDFLLKLHDFLLGKQFVSERCPVIEIARCPNHNRKRLRYDNDLQVNLSATIHSECNNAFMDELKTTFHASPFEIQLVSCVQNQLNVRFVRFKLIEQVLIDITDPNVKYAQFYEDRKIGFELDNDQTSTEDLTCLRSQLYLNVLRKLYAKNGFEIDDNVLRPVRISTRQRHTNTIFCGPVLDTESKRKNTKTTADELVANRTSYMEMIATHRYGLRNVSDIDWQSLGRAAVIFELLTPKISRAIRINSDHLENHKGAVFVLYNYARICSILNKFEQLVIEDVDQSNSIDYTVLSTDEEWCLVYDYLLKYPYLIRTLISDEPKIHQMFAFIEHLCASFSTYYRRIQILVEPRKHLINQLNARIVLLKALRIVLLDVLSLLDVQPLEYM